jgi:serine-type D-Ala-D-Ala carboxypeptidase (penicillin-binding protein 5/6)
MKKFFFLVAIFASLNFLGEVPSFSTESERMQSIEIDSSQEFERVPLKEIDANAYILMDVQTGQILAQKNSNIQFYPASTTKVLTALIALENGNLADELIASNDAIRDIGHNGMNIGISEGEILPLSDLLTAMLTYSANEAANIIAENLAVTKEDFVRQMNLRARELGATGTNFTNPIGVDMTIQDRDHLTTAKDLALITREALKFPDFREIVTRTYISIPPTNKYQEERILGNTNKLLQPYYASAYFEKITGAKTGFTNRAGHCFIASGIDPAGNELIAVILGIQTGNIFDFAKNLLEYGFTNFTWEKLHMENQHYKTYSLGESAQENLRLMTDSEMVVVKPKNTDQTSWTLEKKEVIQNGITLPIHAGEPLGHIEYFLEGSSLGLVPLVSEKTVQKAASPTFKDQMIEHWNSYHKYLIFLGYLILGFTALRISLMLLRKKLRKISKKKIRIKKKLTPENDETEISSIKSHRKTNFKYFKQYNPKE